MNPENPMPRPDARRLPLATYRVQLHAEFTFDDAAEIVPYLAELGITHLYTSPVLQAAPGSTHGYDVVDHGRVNDELGGGEGFARLTDTLRANGMGLLLDTVPNHMAIAGEENRWWWDVLEHGSNSRYAGHFDVDWDPPESRLRNVILLPVLPDHYGRVLEAGGIRLVRDGGRLLVEHADRRFPIDPRTIAGLLAEATDDVAGDDLEAVLDRAVEMVNADVDRLDALLEQQNYRLAFWRAASRDLGYRRFFDIDELIGLRMEDATVFEETHELVLGWIDEGRVDGLRIDHPDGLRDPAGYFDRLGEAAPGAWIVAEKIAEASEQLPAEWPIDGTTGYRFANLATGVLVDPAAAGLFDDAWAARADADADWEAVSRAARAQVLSDVLGSDVNRLTDLFLAVCEENRRYRDFTRHELHHAIREVAAAMPVYRTYARAHDRHLSRDDARVVGDAVALAEERRPDLDPELFAFLGGILRLEVGGHLGGELAMRFQQLTPAAMAKGVEDTAFYRHHRLVALNEVGGDPGRFGIGADAFHRAMEAAHEREPRGLLALSTHDTKRSADVRARLAMLTQDPGRWQAMLSRLEAVGERHRTGPDLPSRADEYLFHQAVVGTWPIDADRAAAYLEKASREAKLRTSWTVPDPAYDAALARFVRGCLGDAAYRAAIEECIGPLVEAGRRASLAQVALQLTAPGVPDVYQGSELWELSLVDPDNRRPVDYELRRRLLSTATRCTAAEAWAEADAGLPKLWLLQRALAVRRRRPGAFGPEGAYRPLRTPGSVIAFIRGEEVATIVPVRTAVDPDVTVELPPGHWIGLDDVVHSGAPRVGDLLAHYPVAILECAA